MIGSLNFRYSQTICYHHPLSLKAYDWLGESIYDQWKGGKYSFESGKTPISRISSEGWENAPPPDVPEHDENP